MGSEGYEYRIEYGPCDNCGKPKSGFMGYGRGGMVCSFACGKRLEKRIENGMIERPLNPLNSLSLYGGYNTSDKGKEERLRLRIKELEGKLRRR